MTTLARRPCLAIRNASLPTTLSLLLDLYYASAINRLKMSLRGARQCEAVLALRLSGKSLSTELWILLALVLVLVLVLVQKEGEWLDQF